MTEDELDAESARVIEAAMGGLTNHEFLVKTSREAAANTEARQAAIQKNRERALRLLAEIEKSAGEGKAD